jgi:hypothetical protein
MHVDARNSPPSPAGLPAGFVLCSRANTETLDPAAIA